MVEGTWQEISKRKQAQRDALIPTEWRLKPLPGPETLNVTSIPRTCGILSPQELDITENYDATALAKAIADRKLKCIDVTIAYCKVWIPTIYKTTSVAWFCIPANLKPREQPLLSS